jgi:hypothetical protein
MGRVDHDPPRSKIRRYPVVGRSQAGRLLVESDTLQKPASGLEPPIVPRRKEIALLVNEAIPAYRARHARNTSNLALSWENGRFCLS